MNKIYKIYVWEKDTNFWTGESEDILINTNVQELKDTPVEFYGDTKRSVIEQIIDELKRRGHHGVIRVH